VEEASEDPEVMELALEEFRRYPRPRGWLVLDLPPRARGYVLRVLQLTYGISDSEELRKLARGIFLQEKGRPKPSALRA
jgi:hypothetical protein